MRSNAGEPEERIILRHQIETTRGELDASNSYLIGLKYELSKTQVKKATLSVNKILFQLILEKLIQ